MALGRRSGRILLGLTGVAIDGGIASVDRCIARALRDAGEAAGVRACDRVLLHGRARPGLFGPGRESRAGGSQIRFAAQLAGLALRGRPDLVFFDHVGPARCMTLPLPGLRGRRHAVFVHGIELAAAQSGSRAAALRGAERILVNSEFTRDLVAAQLGAGCPPIHVVKLCIDPELVERWEADPRPPPEEREPAALIVGRMLREEPGKGHAALIEAWPAVLAEAPRAQLWIVGGGDLAPELAARAAALGLGDAVQFLGRLSDAELHERYRRAALLAMPSRQEGFGLAYAEAWWHALPCIGSTADAAGRLIRPGVDGLLVPFGDAAALAHAIVELLGDPARARRMGEAGRLRARGEFSFERFRADLLRALLGPEVAQEQPVAGAALPPREPPGSALG